MTHPVVRAARTNDPSSANQEVFPEATQAHHAEEHEVSHALNWRDLGRVLFVAVAAGAMWVGSTSSIPYFNAIRRGLHPAGRLSDFP